MKVFSVVMKILVALAAVAGAVYIAATYGDKIVAWAKKLLGSCQCCCGCDCECDGECECECECEDEACECECGCCCEEAAEAPAAEEVAAEADFEN